MIGRLDSDKGGHAVYARQAIAAGELLAVFGGDIVAGAEIGERRYALQVEEDLFVVSGVEGPGDWVNHSCEPNAGLRGQLSLVAMRAIEPGEEVSYDYAMSDGSAYDEFSCACGSPLCRTRVTGDDWQRSELWVRYHGHFSPYLQLRIDRLVAAAQAEPPLRLRVHEPDKPVVRAASRRMRQAAPRPPG